MSEGREAVPQAVRLMLASMSVRSSASWWESEGGEGAVAERWEAAVQYEVRVR